MIKTKNLNKYFNKGKRNEIHVIDNTTIELPDTGLITILGESGSGKTTLLNVLGGLDRFSGELEINDLKLNNYNMTKFDEYRAKNIGYIFQNYYLLPEISIYDNLKKQLEILDIIDPEEVKKRIDYALKVVKLYKYKKKKPTELSGGQQQRASIARALVKETKILICDEPTGNLDSQNSLDIMNILRKISEKSLVLLVTHDKKLASFYSDKILNIVDGKIVDIRDNIKQAAFIDDDSNNVYLGDMNKKEDGNEFKTTIYSNEEIPNINIELVNINGTYYLKSNVKIKLQEDTNLVFINDKHREKTLDEIQDDVTFDLSFHNDVYETNSFKKFFRAFGEAFRNFFKAKAKAKFFRVIFVIIGIFIAGLNVFFCTYNDYKKQASDAKFQYRSDLYTVKEVYRDYYWENMITKYMDYSVSFRNYSTYMTQNDNSITHKEVLVDERIISAPNLEKVFEANTKIKYGAIPTNTKDYVLDMTMAKQIAKIYKCSVKELVGRDIFLAWGAGTISGVLDSGNGYIYQKTSEGLAEDCFIFTEEELKSLGEDSQYFIDYNSDYYSKNSIDTSDIEKTARVVLIITIVLFGIIVVYIFFTMRTKIIGEIKEIGILRSIGMKRTTLLRNNMLEVIVITLFTTLLGFIIGCILVVLLMNELKAILPFSINIFTSYSTYLCVLMMFVVNIIFGMIPMLSLLRKTPNEINTKYDI